MILIKKMLIAFLLCLTSIAVITIFITSSSQAPYIDTIKERCHQIQSSRENTRVFLTISSLYVSTTEDGIVNRQLEINWFGGSPATEDKISVFNTDPIIHPNASSIISIHPQDHPGGFYRSDIIIPVIILNATFLHENHCLGYWVTYQNNKGQVLSSSCLRIQPFWMEENSDYLSHLKLSEIMIPGSHDSGSFYYHKESGPLTKYKYAQEENIFTQMVYGLRYFDLRVGHYKYCEDKYYINHNFLRTEHSVKSVLRQVLQFLRVTKKEIIILDFHNFPIGFNSEEIHEKLIVMIIRFFGPFLIPTTDDYKNATMSYLWEHNKRVLVSYDNPIREKYFQNLMWPSIERAWGNKQHPQDLKSYFEEVFEKSAPEGLWASMAELTPNAKTIILHPETGLRYLADLINRNVTHWFRDHFWHKANIVATDYFLGNNIIDVSIRANRIKGLCPPHYWSNLRP
ncbi:PI-PLC X domain-containing protein 3 isoform X2 [Parasteatoda tepidariorum]|uniref:PI-PLC X domain-containing protein 3 isoform X2 n=1 Tax=Parasteatoda tepidariorum TaxID=114398 RepID=UPI001C722325|nr:PI-PLC X domain-containing protein 3 isoform X2 [Parasteatoda tepidariorum]